MWNVQVKLLKEEHVDTREVCFESEAFDLPTDDDMLEFSKKWKAK